jgi:hypothetical protein
MVAATVQQRQLTSSEIEFGIAEVEHPLLVSVQENGTLRPSEMAIATNV